MKISPDQFADFTTFPKRFFLVFFFVLQACGYVLCLYVCTVVVFVVDCVVVDCVLLIACC